MWSLLPGFCNGPTDLVVSFRSVAKTLGVQLGSRKEVNFQQLYMELITTTYPYHNR